MSSRRITDSIGSPGFGRSKMLRSKSIKTGWSPALSNPSVE
jgi:hypothetical protein